MSEHIAVKLGEAFGLHDGTYPEVIEAEALLYRGDESPSTVRLTDILVEAVNAITPDDEADYVALARFSSLYLPTFIEAWLLASQEDFYCCHCIVARGISDTPEFVHYVQTHPEFVSRAVKVFVPRLPSLSHLLDESTFNQVGDRLQSWGFVLERAILVLSSSSPSAWSSEMDPPLLLSFRNRIFQLYLDLGRFTETSNFSKLTSEQQEHLNQTLVTLYGVSALFPECWRGETLKQHRSRNLSEVAWFSCEARGLGHCRKVQKGEEMMACGRCQLVRYCCREHQRAHWKTHKLACFPPSWG